jgi:hypothetical protein
MICRPAIKNDSSAISQPTEWQHIGNQIDTAMIFVKREAFTFRIAASAEKHCRV